MAILDQVNSMKQQGVSDQEIISSLQQDGYSPKEIKDAIDKSTIKSAVKDEQGNMEEQNYQQGYGQAGPQGFGQSNQGGEQQPFGQESQTQPNQGFGQQTAQPQNYGNQSQDYYQGYQNYGQGSQQAYQPQDNYEPQQSYDYDQNQYSGYGQGQDNYDYGGQQNYYDYGNYDSYGGGYGGGTNTETIMDIADQVVEEKTKEIQKQMRDFQEFQTITQSKLQNFEERIKKMENLVDNLQVKILEKVSSYGKGIENVQKEMGMMQDSFKKMVPELQRRGQEQASQQNHQGQNQNEGTRQPR